ncbi:MAG: GIY-YIG nuclease family protein, partial [Cyclobacteriaceae bacterium]
GSIPPLATVYHFVYALYSRKFDKIYIGRSSNIKARLKSHYYFSSKGFTSKFRPWKLIFLERCDTVSHSIVREKQLKSANGRAYIRSIILQKDS